jgi:hypothetical protein
MILGIYRRNIAFITSIKGINKFIPAQGIAPKPFIAYRTGTISIITSPKVKANNIYTFILFACKISCRRQTNND